MAVPYKIITQKGPPVPGKERSPISYARSCTNGKMETLELARKAAERCTVSTPDVMAVLHVVNELLSEELAAGRSVQLDGLGTFSIKANTGALVDGKAIQASDFKTLRINFFPDKELRTMLSQLSFKKMP